MKKLRLNLDDLTVHSFEIDAAVEPRGTVHGASDGPDLGSRDCGSWAKVEWVLKGTWMYPE